MEGGTLIVVVLIVLALAIVKKGIIMVQQGTECTIERFGEYYATLKPGLHFVLPFFYSIGAKINVKEQVLDVPSQEVITRDNAMVKVDGVVFFQVLNPVKAAYEITNLEVALLNLVTTNIRTVMGGMEMDELLSQRDHINVRLLGVVDDATGPWGVKITRVEIKDISPPRDLVDAMARQMKAERDKRAQILEAEGLKQAEILRADGMKQSAILKAEGEKEAAFRAAEARERSAQAEAKATEMVSQAVENGSVQALNYFIGTKYVEALQSIASANNQKVIMLPLEATNMLGSIAGIGEIAKEAFSKAEEKKITHKASASTTRSKGEKIWE
ncbi:MAG: SPFH domain-containing protein [Alphaproteobacteria bacterium]